MPLVAPLAQPSGLIFGLLSLTSGQKKPLSDATFSRTTPTAIRGVTIQLRSGSAKVADKADATDGWTLTAGVPFGDEAASSLDGWYIIESGGGNATVEIVCRSGGAS